MALITVRFDFSSVYLADAFEVDHFIGWPEITECFAVT